MAGIIHGAAAGAQRRIANARRTVNPTIDFDNRSAHRLAVALAVSLALHALFVFSGTRLLHVVPAMFAPGPTLPGATLAVSLQGVPSSRVTSGEAVITQSRPAAPAGTDAARGAGVGLPRKPAAPAAPPPPPDFELRVAIVEDETVPIPARYEQALERDWPGAVRAHLTFEPPLAIRYPLERMGGSSQRQNRALIVAQPDGSAKFVQAEFDDPVFVEEVEKGLEQVRVLPAAPDGGGGARWTLFVFWLERVAVEPAPAASATAAAVTP